MTVSGEHIALRYIQRRALLLSLVPLGLLFAVTLTLARSYHAKEESLVLEWFQKGNEELAAGKPGPATQDFRNSLSYGPGNDTVQIHLAEALLADNRLSEARAYFVNLWERSPGSGEVNLALARVSMRMKNDPEAIRYFRAAIYGSWDRDTVQRRRKVRFEFCEYLLARGQLSEALTELAALTGDISPEEGLLHERAGRLLLMAGEPGKALSEFEAALQSDPAQTEWLEAAGKAAFEAGEYANSETYLAKAVAENHSSEAVDLLQLSREVLSDDPFRPGLRDEERALRSWRAYEYSLKRLQQCIARQPAGFASEAIPSELQALIRNTQTLKGRVTLSHLRGDANLRIDAMRLVFRIEETTTTVCGMPAWMDRALVIVGQRNGGVKQ